MLDKKYSQPQNIFIVLVRNALDDYEANVKQQLSFKKNDTTEKLEIFIQWSMVNVQTINNIFTDLSTDSTRGSWIQK